MIEVENLTKRFNGFTAVDNISFSIKKGEIFAFLGPNGAGKTTTIRMLTTLLLPTSGKIEINGFNPLIDQDKVRRSLIVGFRPANRALFPLEGLPKMFTIIAGLDPLSYGVDGLRGALLGVFHFGVLPDLFALGFITIVILVLGSYLFSKIQI